MQAAAMQIIYKGVFQWFLKLVVGVQFTDCQFLNIFKILPALPHKQAPV